MRHILILSMLISFSCLSQQLKYGTGGNVYNSAGQKVDPDIVRDLMKSKPVALELYNSGRSKKTWGNTLFYGGLGLGAINVISAATTDNTSVDAGGNVRSRRASPILAVAGGLLVVVSIPVKIGYTKKIKRAIDEYNGGVAFQKSSLPQGSIIANNRGIGLAISF